LFALLHFLEIQESPVEVLIKLKDTGDVSHPIAVVGS